MLGADGVVVGSRLWASAEALTRQAHTDKAIAVTGDATIRTKVLDALKIAALAAIIIFGLLLGKLGATASDVTTALAVRRPRPPRNGRKRCTVLATITC
jgi:hypothetical protein